MGDHGSHQQSAVTGEKHSVFTHRRLCDLLIVPGVVVEGVETGKTQVAGQSAQMDVGQEAQQAQRLRTNSGDPSDVKSLENRVYADAVARRETIREVH